jgi:hypothetical protein
MSETLRLMITYDEPEEDGWIVARVLEVPGAISQGRTQEEARENVVTLSVWCSRILTDLQEPTWPAEAPRPGVERLIGLRAD